MNKKLLALLVRGSENGKDPQIRERCAAAASWVGIASNAFLALIKLTVGLLSASISITADAVNNLSDAASSVITLVGFKLSAKPADAEHPYGHRRIEYITGLIVSMVITVLGVEFLTSSIDSLLHPTVTVYSISALIILALSILIKLWQCRFYITVSRHIDSGSLMAAAADSRNDMLSTAVVLAGALISRFTGADLDGWLGLALGAYVIWSGIRLVIETSNPLLGAAPSAELIQSIRERILSYDGILGYHDLVVHNYGPDRCFASVHVEVPASQDILVSHDIIDNIEFDFLRAAGIHMVIHLDPIVTDDEEVNSLRSRVGDLLAALSAELGHSVTMHDFRVVKGQTHTNLLFDITVPFACPLSDKALVSRIEAQIREISPLYNAVITCDRSYAEEK